MKKILILILIISFFPILCSGEVIVAPYLAEINSQAVISGNSIITTVWNKGTLSRNITVETRIEKSNGEKISFGEVTKLFIPNEKKVFTVNADVPANANVIVLTKDAKVTKEFYVALNGNDENDGSLERPFKTIDRARRAVRNIKYSIGLPIGGINVYLREGTYTVTDSQYFNNADSGLYNSPITYTAYNNEKVVISGSHTIDSTAFTPAGLSNPNIKKVDLKSIGIEDLGSITRANAFESETNKPSSTMLYCDGKMQTIARYPNKGENLITGDVIPLESNGDNYGGSVTFSHNIANADKWNNAKDIWVRGYFRVYWYQDSVSAKVNSQDITLKYPTAYGISKGQEYYIFNLLEELDMPSEFYIDRETGILYYYPEDETKRIELTFFEKPLFVMNDCNNIFISGIEFSNSRASGVTINNCNNVGVEGCNFSGLGGQAVKIDGGTNCGVLSCNIKAIGRGGITLIGGNRNTLTPSNHFVQNCDIYDYCTENATYSAAILLKGVGNSAKNNSIHDAPHVGISLSGNDHLVENNRLYNLCTETQDCGAIYGGADWTFCGNVIKKNLFYNILGKSGSDPFANSIYFDDLMSGNTVTDNIFYNVYSAVFIHGGRATDIKNNTVVTAKHSFFQRNISNFSIAANPGRVPRDNYRKIFTENDDLQLGIPINQEWLKYNGEPSEKYPFYRRLDKIVYDQANYPKYNSFMDNNIYNAPNVEYTELAKESGEFLRNEKLDGIPTMDSFDINEMGTYVDKWRR